MVNDPFELTRIVVVSKEFSSWFLMKIKEHYDVRVNIIIYSTLMLDEFYRV